MAELFDLYVPEWRSDGVDCDRIEEIPDAELWSAHEHQRRAMIQFINDSAGAEDRLQEDALTIVWARRFAEYKRAGLLATDMDRLERLMANAEKPVQLVISGKAHPKDEGGKRMLQGLLSRLRSHPAIGPRFAFLPDYSIAIARRLAAGADVWLNTPRKPLEASGTSGMKSSDNGGLQLTVTDGWADEVDWSGTGWAIDGKDDRADALQVYENLENSVVPTFYNRDDSGIPREWVSMMKRTMQMSLQRYSARRMLIEYVDKLYLPLLGAQDSVE